MNADTLHALNGMRASLTVIIFELLMTNILLLSIYKAILRRK
jgi:hypothetical protein